MLTRTDYDGGYGGYNVANQRQQGEYNVAVVDQGYLWGT